MPGLVEGGDPEATFATESGTALHAQLAGTWILEGQIGVGYALENLDGQRVAMVTESCVPVTRPSATGFERRFRVVEQVESVRLRLPGPRADEEEVDAFAEGSRSWRVWRRADGLFEVLALSGTVDGTLANTPEGEWNVSTQHFVLPAWNEEIRAAWLQEESR